MKKVVLCVFFKGTLGLFGGGGGHVPLMPPPLGPVLAIEKFYFYIFTLTASDLDLDKCSDVRMRENYVTKGIPKTSYRIHHLYVC